jgi:hypothetical protein
MHAGAEHRDRLQHDGDVQDDDGDASADDTSGGPASHADEATWPAAPLTQDDDDDLVTMGAMPDDDMDDFLRFQPMSAYFLDGGGAASVSGSDAGSSGEIDGGCATWGSLWNLDDVVVDVDVHGGGACCLWDSFPLPQDQRLTFY